MKRWTGWSRSTDLSNLGKKQREMNETLLYNSKKTHQKEDPDPMKVRVYIANF